MTVCDSCNGEKIIVPTPNTVHHSKEICSKCGKWFRWIKNPEKENKRTKTSKCKNQAILRHHNYKEEFCFFCLRTKEQLGKHETITRDHIQELDKGGKDELQNIQLLCSACHKLKNWARLYMNWHLK